jgi:GT2 family glycosyltransferase
MSSRPFVSIVISNYNGGAFIKECLNSLINLDYPNYEIIVVDAGSTDGSPEFISMHFPSVRLIKVGRMGIGKAINIGIKQARGEVIVFDFNSDEIASKKWLSNLIDVLYSSERIGVVGGTRILYGTNGIIDDAGMKFNIFGHASKILRGRTLNYLHKEPAEVDYVNCVATRREVINKIGMLDETFYIYGEDADFCIRAKKAGYKVIQVPSAITYHKVSASIGGQTPKQIYFLRRANMRIAIKHFSPIKILISMAWFSFMIFVDAMMLFPAIRKIALKTPYPYYAMQGTPAHLIASLRAFLWNLKNMQTTIMARSK